MTATEDQHFCLRWNNFQENITSQFESLRDDEDFTDVTIACKGQQLQAHKIILSACSPLFKELLKSNPCPHPIIFMRDVEAQDIVALMEFMYAGEVNVAQAQLSTFLKTAEALKIRGLTDTSSNLTAQTNKETELLNTQPSPSSTSKQRLNKSEISCSSIVTSSQDVGPLKPPTPPPPPPTKRCKIEKNDVLAHNHLLLANNQIQIEPKNETVDYFSDEDGHEDGSSNFNSIGDVSELIGGMEVIPQNPSINNNQEEISDVFQGTDNRKLHFLDPRPCQECGRMYSNLSNLRQHLKLIHHPTNAVCSICKKSFKTNLYLKRHMSNVHNIFNTNASVNPSDCSRIGDTNDCSYVKLECMDENYSMFYG